MPLAILEHSSIKSLSKLLVGGLSKPFSYLACNEALSVGEREAITLSIIS